MPKKVPVNETIELIKQGYSDEDIISHLRDSGYTPQEINDAINQAKIKLELAETAGEEYPTEEYVEAAPEAEAAPAVAPAPTTTPAPAYAYPEYYPAPSAEEYTPTEAPSVETIEEIAEGIISEKWEEFKMKVGDIGELKTHFESRMNELNERVKRLESAMDRLSAAVLEKVEAQNKSVRALSSEVETLEGTLGKVIQPLVSSVKELKRMAEKKPKKK